LDASCSQRFWSAAAAVGCILFTALLGKHLFSPIAGLWSGFALSTSMHFLYEHCAKTGEMDSLLLFLVVASLFFLVKSEERAIYLPLSATLMGLASITKNFAGFVPFGIGVAYLLITGNWKKYSRSKIAYLFSYCLEYRFSGLLK
jgi:4-amino-4-deoxy-L-arabinose transferase-like glycosyltransferase